MTMILDGTNGATLPVPLTVGNGGTGNAAGYNVSNYSMFRSKGFAANGATNTAIKRVASGNILVNQGGDITWVDDSNLGTTFTINTNGVYALSQTLGLSVAGFHGFSLNATQFTSDINGLTGSQHLASTYCYSANVEYCVSATLYLPAGSVIRSHGFGAIGGYTDAHSLIITRVA